MLATEPVVSRRITNLLAEGSLAIAASRRAITRSRLVRDSVREVIVTYRAHRFRSVSGSSDTLDSAASEPSGIADPGVPSGDGAPAVRARRGSLGGFARAAKLTAEQRRDIARKAAAARWRRFRDGIGTGPPDPRLGGLARAQTLSDDRRKEIARQAALAMWNRWKPTPPTDAAQQ